MMNKMINMAMMMVLDAAAIGALNVGDRWPFVGWRTTSDQESDLRFCDFPDDGRGRRGAGMTRFTQIYL
jgi:hypothetical protein